MGRIATRTPEDEAPGQETRAARKPYVAKKPGPLPAGTYGSLQRRKLKNMVWPCTDDEKEAIVTFSSQPGPASFPKLSDGDFAAMLGTTGTLLTLPEVRAYLMGTIAGTGHAPMQKVYDHVLGGKEPSFDTLDQAKTFMQAMMAYWNTLASHQDVQNPFRLFPTDPDPSLDSLKARAILRKAEIEQFIKGLDAGQTDPDEFDEEARTDFRYLAESLSIFNGMIDLLNRTTDAKKKELGETLDKVIQMEEPVAQCMNGIIHKCQALRAEKIVALKEKEALKEKYRHVGRNEPCPCGSGIKFKKCCSLKIH